MDSNDNAYVFFTIQGLGERVSKWQVISLILAFINNVIK